MWGSRMRRRGGGGMGGTSDRRFSLTVGANFTNILNHFNPGGYDGVLPSTQFGQAPSVNTGFGGGGPAGAGMGSPANNRRIDLGLLADDPPVQGDWVLIHVGFAMSRIDADEAVKTLELLQELGEMDQELAAFGLEDLS